MEYKQFLTIDLRLSKRTVYQKLRYLKKFLNAANKPAEFVSQQDVRAYLIVHRDDSPACYKNLLGALKTFFRDFLDRPEVVATFKFPEQPFKRKVIPSREDLRMFYGAIDSDIGKALFLMYATTGLRKNEVLSLKLSEVDFNKRMIMPNCHSGRTKCSYVSFFNEETEKLLSKIIQERSEETDKLFSISDRAYRKIWKNAGKKTGLNITPQRLREWFCSEMALSGVSDSYIDAFCGRTPRSVLSRHYLDYSPERLKRIYDRANLKLLT